MIIRWPYSRDREATIDTSFVSAVNVYKYSKRKWIVDVFVLGYPAPFRRVIGADKNVRPDVAIREVFALIGWEEESP